MLNTLADIKAVYLKELAGIYDEGEIRAIFRSLCWHIFNKSEMLIDTISQEHQVLFGEYLAELAKGKPVQHIIGLSHFYNLDFYVSPDVLIPRPETEELVHYIINKHKSHKTNVLDVCTGSSCIAVALQKNLPHAQVTAIDISEKALQIAQKNIALNQSNVVLIKDDALQLDAAKYPEFDIIVSNPPYIAESEKQGMHKNVLDYEPHLALFVPDDDALKFYDSIADFALTKLRPEGFLYFEINQYLAIETELLLQLKGFKVLLIKDLNDNYRFLEAQLLG